MKIGLINIEPKIVNTAYMQISTYYKNNGDKVEWFTTQKPLDYYDHIYCSSLFDFTDKRCLPDGIITGGSGFDVKKRLPAVIENCDYDYNLYPECNYSIVWFSRGCIRNCPFCVVQQKEGNIRAVEPHALNDRGEYIVVQDNNFFANPQWQKAAEKLKQWRQPVSFNGGIDVRLIEKEQCDFINSVKLHKQIYIAWDNPKQDLRPYLDTMTRYIKPYKIACYVLIGYWSTPEEDLHRVETLRQYKIDPFVMPYNKKDRYQRNFARWVNHKALFKSVKWSEYKPNTQQSSLF